MTADLTRATLEPGDPADDRQFSGLPHLRRSCRTPDDADLRDLAWAITRARRSDPDLHPSAFDFLELR